MSTSILEAQDPISITRERRTLMQRCTDLAKDVARAQRCIKLLGEQLADPDSDIVDQITAQRRELLRLTSDLRAAEAELARFNEQHLTDQEIQRREGAHQAEIRRQQEQERRKKFAETLRLWQALTVLQAKRDQLAAEIEVEGSIPGLNPMLVDLGSYQPNTNGLLPGASNLAIARESQIRQLIKTFDATALEFDDEHSALREVNRILGADEETPTASV